VSALGGDCVGDFDNLRRDQGLAALLGYQLPAAATARQFLERFHDPAVLADRPQQGSFIPRETDGLAGLQSVLERTVPAYVSAAQAGVHADAGRGRSGRGAQQKGGHADGHGRAGLPAAGGELGGDGAGAGRRVS